MLMHAFTHTTHAWNRPGFGWSGGELSARPKLRHDKFKNRVMSIDRIIYDMSCFVF